MISCLHIVKICEGESKADFAPYHLGSTYADMSLRLLLLLETYVPIDCLLKMANKDMSPKDRKPHASFDIPGD